MNYKHYTEEELKAHRKAYNDKYHLEHKEQEREYNKKKYQANKELLCLKNRMYYRRKRGLDISDLIKKISKLKSVRVGKPGRCRKEYWCTSYNNDNIKCVMCYEQKKRMCEKYA